MKKLKVAKVLSLVLVLPAGMVLVTFAVVNRGPVTIDFWPLPIDMQAPLSAEQLLAEAEAAEEEARQANYDPDQELLDGL